MKKRILVMFLSALLVTNISACSYSAPENQNGLQDKSSSMLEEKADPAPEEPKTDEEWYNKALALLETGDVWGAYNIFLTISDFKDVSERLEHFAFRVEKSEHYGEYEDCKFSFEYDDYGRRTLQKIVYMDTGREYLWSYQYNEQGLLIQVGERSGSSSERITRYEYDEAGNPIYQINADGNVISLEYDSNGNITKIIGGEYIRERTYDAYGNLTEEILKTENNYWLQTTTYEYNEQGDLIKRIVYDGGTIIDFEGRYEYDERGNKIRFTHGANRTEWEYDESGNMIKYAFYDSDGTFVIFHLKYDEHGNEIEQRREDENGFSHATYSEYDDYGNLIKRITDYPNSLEQDNISIYTYRLCYNPNAVLSGIDPYSNLPEEMVGKG